MSSISQSDYHFEYQQEPIQEDEQVLNDGISDESALKKNMDPIKPFRVFIKEKISEKQLEKTFRTNIFSYFFMVKASLKHLKKKAGVIINTTSVTAYRGSERLLDYSATKGAIVSFTRSLALALVEQKIRVNGVAPGPIWTPLIASTFTPKKIETFGSDVPMKRAGEPAEVASCFVFLASADS